MDKKVVQRIKAIPDAQFEIKVQYGNDFKREWSVSGADAVLSIRERKGQNICHDWMNPSTAIHM